MAAIVDVVSQAAAGEAAAVSGADTDAVFVGAGGILGVPKAGMFGVPSEPMLGSASAVAR